MHTLHRCDHAKLLEARYVGGINVLRMLDAPAEIVLGGIVPENTLVDVGHFAIGAIADRVNVHLEVVLQREAGRTDERVGDDRR